MIAFDERETIVFVNSRAERLFGYDRNDLFGKPVTFLLPRASDVGLDTSAQAAGVGLSGRRADGSEFPAEIGLSFFEHNGVRLNVASVRDITRATNADLALLESEQRYRRLFESNPQPMWVFDVETLRFLAVNNAAVQKYGYSVEEFLAMTVADIRPEEQVGAFLSDHSNFTSPIVLQGVWTHRKKDGTLFQTEVSAHNLEFDGRRARMALINDITERLKTEEALRESERTLRALVGSLDEIVFEYDARGSYLNVWTNDPIRLDRARASLIGRTVTDVLGEESAGPLLEAIRRVLETGQSEEIEYLWTQSTPNRWYLGRINRISRGDGTFQTVSMLCREITGQKRLEEQLRQAQKLEAVGRLAGGVAHDFNNMLSVIVGGSELALNDPGNVVLVREMLGVISTAGKRATELTQQLLAFSRSQLLEAEILAINDVIADTERMLRRLVGDDIHLRTVLGPGVGPIQIDPTQIDLVLVNLAVNARDAMPDGGTLTIETRNVDIDESHGHVDLRPGRYVLLAVSDTGQGMDKATRARVFEPFFTTKEIGRGTGLGLSSVYGIVKQSGGGIEVDSEPGAGTTFNIYLPVADETVEPIIRHETPVQAVLGSGTILLVEDEETLRKLAHDILLEEGYTVLEAADGVDALSVAVAYPDPIHLLLTDVVLPRLNGWALAERIVARYPDIRVLFMSGYTDETIDRPGIPEEHTAYLTKPFGPDTLTDTVRALLEGAD